MDAKLSDLIKATNGLGGILSLFQPPERTKGSHFYYLPFIILPLAALTRRPQREKKERIPDDTFSLSGSKNQKKKRLLPEKNISSAQNPKIKII